MKTCGRRSSAAAACWPSPRVPRSADELRGAGADVVFEDLRDTAAVVAALAELGAEEPAEFESARHTPSAQLAWPGRKSGAPEGKAIGADWPASRRPRYAEHGHLGHRGAESAGTGRGRLRPTPDDSRRRQGAQRGREPPGCLVPARWAFVGRTVRDRFGLWRVPEDAVALSRVDTRFIRISSAAEESGAPAVALVAVDVDGRHSQA